MAWSSEEGLEDTIVVDDRDGGENLGLGSGDVEPGNQKVVADEEVKNVIDDSTPPASRMRLGPILTQLSWVSETLYPAWQERTSQVPWLQATSWTLGMSLQFLPLAGLFNPRD
jgi:hypothetical protein